MTASLTEEQRILQTWSTLWQSKQGDVAPWDSLSESVFLAVVAEAKPISGRRIMEAGCGTGRISARLADGGAMIACLDIAPEALALAKKQFAEPDRASFIEGSILSVPRGEKYDVIWNSGVMEHFVESDQMAAIREFLAILKPGGRLILLTPYARSGLYRLGKWVLEKLGKWPFGREIPVRTLLPVLPPEGKLVREYSVSFLPLLFDSYKWIPPLKPLMKFLYWGFEKILGTEGLFHWDLRFSRWFGGYLLVSVIEGDRSLDPSVRSC
jgi:2-polyprenyl-3-methyl-5-hydroxy-6-metoxy-1,4-benzoquinol methylase